MKQEIENRGAELVVKVCPTCCIVYAIQSSMESVKYGNSENWFCPNGHSLVCKETEADNLKKQLEGETAKYESLRRHSQGKSETIESMNRTIASLRGQITKLKGAAK